MNTKRLREALERTCRRTSGYTGIIEFEDSDVVVILDMKLGLPEFVKLVKECNLIIEEDKK